jgi:hypothetical protein
MLSLHNKVVHELLSTFVIVQLILIEFSVKADVRILLNELINLFCGL